MSNVLTRLWGVGLAAALSAVTLVLWVTDRLALYINPDGAWFAVGMAFLTLAGCVASFLLPLGAEADHDHGHASGADDQSSSSDHDHAERLTPLPVAGGLLATGIVGFMLVTPPAALSAELAMSRDTGAPPLFQGADAVTLAASGDTESFGIGEWSSVMATTTNPETFSGEPVTLTGFATPGDSGFSLTRLVVTHCVIDAQPVSVAIDADAAPETGQWVTVEGTIQEAGGRLVIRPTSIDEVDEPEDPYEY